MVSGLLPIFFRITCSSPQDLLRCRTVWYALAVLVAVTSSVYYDLWNLNVLRESTAQGPAFEVVDLPGKGKGVVALREIKVFTLRVRMVFTE